MQLSQGWVNFIDYRFKYSKRLGFMRILTGGTVGDPAYHRGSSEHRDPRPRDHTDAAQDVACELADVAGQLACVKDEALNWLDDPNYGAVRLRIENVHAAVEAAAVEARSRRSRWGWYSGYALVPCSRNCVQNPFLEVRSGLLRLASWSVF